MMYKYSELLKKYGSRRKADYQITSGKYVKITKGLYKSRDDLTNPYELLCAKYSNITITLQSAAVYYGLTEYIPKKYSIVSIRNQSPIKDKNVSQTYMKKEMFYIGRERIETESGFFYIYDKERLLIEIIRHKSKLPFEFYKDVINNYRQLVVKRELNLLNLVEYLSQITYGDGFLSRIEEVIL